MIRGENSRRGLSPLIATILLIAFAVSLGVMIMSWSIDTGETSAPTNQEGCTAAQISLQEIPTGDAICYDEEKQTVNFLLQNTGSVEITQLTLRVIDSQQNVTEQQLNAELQPGDLGSFEVRHPVEDAQTLVANILPRVADGAFSRSCPEKQLQEVRLPTC